MSKDSTILLFLFREVKNILRYEWLFALKLFGWRPCIELRSPVHPPRLVAVGGHELHWTLRSTALHKFALWSNSSVHHAPQIARSNQTHMMCTEQSSYLCSHRGTTRECWFAYFVVKKSISSALMYKIQSMVMPSFGSSTKHHVPVVCLAHHQRMMLPYEPTRNVISWFKMAEVERTVSKICHSVHARIAIRHKIRYKNARACSRRARRKRSAIHVVGGSINTQRHYFAYSLVWFRRELLISWILLCCSVLVRASDFLNIAILSLHAHLLNRCWYLALLRVLDCRWLCFWFSTLHWRWTTSDAIHRTFRKFILSIKRGWDEKKHLVSYHSLASYEKRSTPKRYLILSVCFALGILFHMSALVTAKNDDWETITPRFVLVLTA